MQEANQKTNVKSMIEFDQEHSNSIKAVMVKQNPNVKVTTRFISGKMLMFPKVSVKSFVYDIIDVFMFPDETAKSIYEKYNIKKCYVYQNLTDTDSTSILFVFICNMNCVVDELTARNIIFEVMITSKILKQLDISDDFWAQFNVQGKKVKKQVGLFETENVNRANVITIAINPKEYLEEFEDLPINKKHKGVKKGTRGMTFDAYCSKHASVTDYFNCQIKPTEKIKQKRFQVINDAMQMYTVNKIQFGQLNDKRFYFPNGIVSLPFGHFLFDVLRKEKGQNRKIHLQIKEKKWDFMKKENEILNKNERLSVLCKIVNGCPKIYLLNSDISVFLCFKSTKEYIISNIWQ